MIKKFLIFMLGLILIFAGFVYWNLSDKKTLIIPYPYSFNSDASRSIASELTEAQNAKILILGDRMGMALSNYTNDLSTEFAKNFKNSPRIYNWSRPHEGLHRTLFKLKSLKKWPSIIIYHGASTEYSEKFFEISDKAAILKNFMAYDDEKIFSLIITFPWLSKLVYKKMHYIELGTFKEVKNNLTNLDTISEKEIAFKLFDYELRELIDLAKDHKSSLIFITTPLNLEIAPKAICSSSTSKTVLEVQQDISKLINEGNYKSAFPQARELAKETVGNAQSYYLLGKISLGLGDLKLARETLGNATTYDCENWRGNIVYNSILKKQASARQIPLIDFDQYLSSALSKEGLFIDDIFPQNVFYQTMIDELKEALKKLLRVNE